MTQILAKPVYDFFSEMNIGDKAYTQDYFELALRSEATRWNKYTDRKYRVKRDDEKVLYIYRES